MAWPRCWKEESSLHLVGAVGATSNITLHLIDAPCRLRRVNASSDHPKNDHQVGRYPPSKVKHGPGAGKKEETTLFFGVAVLIRMGLLPQ